jgi:thiol:disulfide interchange protein DsbD
MAQPDARAGDGLTRSVTWPSLRHEKLSMKRILSSLLLLLALVLSLSSGAAAQTGIPFPVKVIAQSETKTVAPGAAGALRVRFTLPSPLHANANPASESYLIPVSVKFASTREFQFAAPVYPRGKNTKFAFSSKPISVYQGEVEIRVPFTVSPATKGGTQILAGTLRYQPCNETSCFAPVNVTLRAAVEIGGATASLAEGAVGSQGTAPAGAAPAGTTATSAQLNAEASKLQREYSVVGIPAIVFLDKNGKERTDLRAGEEMTRKVFLAKLAALQSGEAWRDGDSGGAAGWGDKLRASSLWLQLLLVFFVGLGLNLTPCVFPMIPLTVGYFGAQSEGRIGKTFTLALFYVFGLSLVYSSLGVVAAMTGSLFGSLLQNPWVVLTVAAIFFALALSMLGVFVLNPPQFLMKRSAKSGSKTGVMGAFGMGALLGIVAAPCVGPAVAALLIFVGQRGDAKLGFLLFFFLSLGLGLPYLLLGAFSGALKSLPRSGKWMVTSKKIFALPILAMSLWYAYQGINAFSAGPAAASTREQGWMPATYAALGNARAAGQPVVIDFRADWCLPCRKMEKDIFQKPEVLKAAQATHLLRADLTNAG